MTTIAITDKMFSCNLRRTFLFGSKLHRPTCVSRRSLQTYHVMAVNVEQLQKCREELTAIIKSKNCNPILVRLAWHDSGTFNKDLSEKWPICGGANGSIRFKPEIDHDANKGLNAALDLVEPVKAACPDVSYADIYQMASALAIEIANGPKIPMKYGRVDAKGPEDCPPQGNLPAGGAPWPNKESSPAEHLRNIFYRMGLNDKEIVALSGAHTIGRAYPHRSGFGKDKTKYTESGPGTIGGSSWTPEWLKFDNSYFVEVKAKRDEDLLVLETDACLFEDPDFKPYAEKYANDQEEFFNDYAEAHTKLSELGVKWTEGGPINF